MADPILLETVPADQDGQASHEAFVPASASGTTIYLQAVGFDPSAMAENHCTVSNLVAFTYP